MKRKLRTIYKRKRQGKTDYKKRLNLLKSRKPRFVVRRSLNNVQLQIISYGKTGDKILTSAHSNQLKKLGWKHHKSNASAAYLTGLIVGCKAKSQNIDEAILDLGLYRALKGSVLFAALKGALEADLKVPHSNEDIFPKKEKLEAKEGFKEIKEKILKEKW
jgi:large subunit ribosomal protein L18